VGTVNKVGADYLGLLVLGFINASVAADQIRAEFRPRFLVRGAPKCFAVLRSACFAAAWPGCVFAQLPGLSHVMLVRRLRTVPQLPAAALRSAAVGARGGCTCVQGRCQQAPAAVCCYC
jgi:hypothetical protein